MPNENQNIETPNLKGKTVEQFLREIEDNLMIDDHGQVVIGERKKRPKLPDLNN